MKAKWLADTLTNAVQEDWQAHEKKPLKETKKESEVKNQKQSLNAPDAGKYPIYNRYT